MNGNGIIIIRINGKEYPLKFGVQAVSAFAIRQERNTLPIGSVEGNMLEITNLFFCGLYGNSILNDLPIMSYQECGALFEELNSEPDGDSQLFAMMECYKASVIKIGEDRMAKMPDTDKKKALKKSKPL